MAEYRLSRRAAAEIVNIFEFGLAQFGPNQASRYRDELKHCLSLLASYPRMGRPAERIAPGLRRHEHGSHVILYREEKDGILVVAVVHGRNVRGLRV